MSEDYQRVEVITGTARRRSWSPEQKLRIIEESPAPGETISSVARRNGVAPNLLYRWRRLMSEGGATAVGSDEPVVGSSEVRRLEERVRELERLLAFRGGERVALQGEVLVGGGNPGVADPRHDPLLSVLPSPVQEAGFGHQRIVCQACAFRRKAAGHSDGSRPVIPTQASHPGGVNGAT